MALIVHGGAGEIPEEERPGYMAGLERSIEKGWAVLRSGGPALEAVEAAINVLEDDPIFDAGVGSVLRLDGSVSMDASIMDGATRRAGAVAGLSRVRHPISLARHILEKTPHVFFISQGAEALARAAGLELCDPSFFVVPSEVRRLEKILAGDRGHRQETGAGVRGTVGAVARDWVGHISAGTSTGGAPGMPPGRVGDTPIIGAGTFADDRWGGASVTGLGENMIRTTLAREVVRVAGIGVSASAAARWGTEFLRAETGGTCGVICLGSAGEAGAAYSTLWMGSLSRDEPIP